MQLNFSHKLISKAIGIVKRELLRHSPINKIIIGVSGGQDSIALLGILHILSKPLRFEIIVCHINHGLRSESTDEAVFVKTLCGQLNVKCVIYEFNLNKEIKDLANHARKLRKQHFEKLKNEENADLILLAHTKTDQCETILMHLTRGSGINGAGGMQILIPPYLRPFLYVTRSETFTICQLLGLNFVSDPTNDNIDTLRIALRSVIIPTLEQFNGRVQDAFLKFALQAQSTNELIAQIAKDVEISIRCYKDSKFEQQLVSCLIERSRLIAGWNIVNFDKLSQIVRYEVLKIICKNIITDESKVRFDVIENIDFHICNKHVREFSFPDNIKLKIDGKFLFFYKTQKP